MISDALYIIYIPAVRQTETVNWIEKTAQALSRYYSVLFLTLDHESVLLGRDILNNPLLIVKMVINFVKSKIGNFSSLQISEILPMRRFHFIERLNEEIFYFTLKLWTLPHKRIVIITNIPLNEHSRIISTVKPIAIIGDYPDLYAKDKFNQLVSQSDILLTNSVPLQNKIQTKKSFLISAGYFSRKNILALARNKNNKIAQNPSVLFIGTLTWRIDFELLLYLVKSLPKITFIFLHTPLFEFDLSNEDKKAQQSCKKLWEKIKKNKNVVEHIVKNQDELSLENDLLHANVGIVPYDMEFEFNHYCHPIKIYDYFALGIPVISPKIRSIEQFEGDYLHFVKNKLEFKEKIEKLVELNVNKKIPKKLLKYCLDQTFEKKAEEIKDILEDFFYKRS